MFSAFSPSFWVQLSGPPPPPKGKSFLWALAGRKDTIQDLPLLLTQPFKHSFLLFLPFPPAFKFSLDRSSGSEVLKNTTSFEDSERGEEVE